MMTGEMSKIIFIGNMRTQANQDAVRYFINDIYPLIQKEIKDVEFKVIGINPPKWLQKLNGKNGIIITGEVKSIIDECKDATVAVAPMRFGAGVQNKILEYMAMGIPVVTTSIGAEGI